MTVAPTVLVNGTIVGERPTGLGVYTVELVRALAPLGLRLRVATSRAAAFEGCDVELLPASALTRPERGRSGHAARIAWTQLGLRRLGARTDVVLNPVPEGLLASRTPQVTVVHDLLPLRYPDEYPRQHYYFRHYVPAVLRASRRVVASSESTGRDLAEFYGVGAARIRIVQAGCDTERYRPGPAPPAGAPYALYVGNVMPHKNLVRLVEAFALGTPLGKELLVIRGSGRDAHVQALKGAIARLGLGPRVDWQPWTGPDALPELYRGARMLLLPSLWEGFGLTALEAMACGTPVVAANRASLPAVVGPGGLLVDPEDTAALAGAMARMFADDELHARLRARGLDHARVFPWGRTAEGVRDVLEEVAREGR